MLMTKETCVNCWCPHYQGWVPNASVNHPSYFLCFGPACSQWRWYDTEVIVDNERRGYCGLAGPIVQD